MQRYTLLEGHRAPREGPGGQGHEVASVHGIAYVCTVQRSLRRKCGTRASKSFMNKLHPALPAPQIDWPAAARVIGVFDPRVRYPRH